MNRTQLSKIDQLILNTSHLNQDDPRRKELINLFNIMIKLHKSGVDIPNDLITNFEELLTLMLDRVEEDENKGGKMGIFQDRLSNLSPSNSTNSIYDLTSSRSEQKSNSIRNSIIYQTTTLNRPSTTELNELTDSEFEEDDEDLDKIDSPPQLQSISKPNPHLNSKPSFNLSIYSSTSLKPNRNPSQRFDNSYTTPTKNQGNQSKSSTIHQQYINNVID